MELCSLPAIGWILLLIVVLEATAFLTILVANMEIWMYSVGTGTEADVKRGIDMTYTHGLIMTTSPIITAFLADNFLGRYFLVTVHSVFIVLGYTLYVASTYTLGQVPFWLALGGMLLVAVGEGISRVIFPTYCADQIHGRSSVTGERMISLYYVFLQIGGLLVLVTDLSKDMVKCDGKPCFRLMFVIGLTTSLLALVLHIATTKWIQAPKFCRNVLVEAVKCIYCAITKSRQDTSESSQKESSQIEEVELTGTFMDKAYPEHSRKFIADVTQTLRVCRLFFIGIPYYTCYYGVYGIFVSQFFRVNSQIGSFKLTPIMYLTTNPIVITLSVFILRWLTELMSKFYNVTHLKKIALGGLVTATAYGLVMIVELKIQSDALPSLTSGVRSVFYVHPSSANCNFDMKLLHDNRIIYLGNSNVIILDDLKNDTYLFNYDCTNGGILNAETNELRLQSGVNVIFISGGDSSPKVYVQNLYRPYERITNGSTEVIVFGHQMPPKSELFEYIGLQTLEKTIFYGVNDSNSHAKSLDISLNGESGATIVYFDGNGYSNTTGQPDKVIKQVVIPPYGVSILWMFPQLILMGLVELLITVSVMEFAYSQTIPTMRTFIQALWLLTSAFGSLTGLILNQFHLSVITKCLIYSSSMTVTTVIFIMATRFYTYITPAKSSEGVSSENKESAKEESTAEETRNQATVGSIQGIRQDL